MKLSFVIPAYNEESYVGDCLDAIVAQKKEFVNNGGSPDAIEIIVVNNASTDDTAAIVKKYPDVQLVNEPEKGIVHARRAGFLASTGELIANVDADTRITPGWIKKVMDEFARDPKLVGLSGPFIYYDAPWKVRLVAKFSITSDYLLFLNPIHISTSDQFFKAETSSSAATRSKRSAAMTRNQFLWRRYRCRPTAQAKSAT